MFQEEVAAKGTIPSVYALGMGAGEGVGCGAGVGAGEGAGAGEGVATGPGTGSEETPPESGVAESVSGPAPWSIAVSEEDWASTMALLSNPPPEQPAKKRTATENPVLFKITCPICYPPSTNPE